MIARVKFEGLVEGEGTKSVLSDYVDIHVPPEKGLLRAKTIFLSWVGHGTAIRGADNGVFHPLMGYGDIKIKNVVEIVGDEEGPCLVDPPPAPKSITKVKAKKGKTTVRPVIPVQE